MDLNLSPDAYTGSQRPQGEPSFEPSEPFWIIVPADNGLSEWITFAQWVNRLAKPLPLPFHLTHMALGVSGEAGELVDAIKKHAIYEKPIDVENLKEELGDLLFYMQGIINVCPFGWDDVVSHNRDKLLKRYSSGSYSNAQAVARADKLTKPANAKPQCQIEDWSIELGRLHGFVGRHPSRAREGYITSSPILRHENGQVETLNTMYILGKPRRAQS